MATTLRKTDPFESTLIEMVETARRKAADYEPDAANVKGHLPTNFDEVAREIPLADYTAVMDARMRATRCWTWPCMRCNRRPEDPRVAALRALGVDVGA